MKFSLSKYLTEKIQSSIIANELLNDTGGFFKIYKIFSQKTKSENNNHYFDRLISRRIKLKKLFDTCHTRKYYSGGYVRKTSTDFSGAVTDKQYIKLHAEYMKVYNEYIKLAKRIFTTPSGELLNTIIGYTGSREYTADIANITDNMFKKYTYADIKKDKALYNKLQNDCIVFFMRNDKTILAFVRNGNIRMYNYNIYKSLYLTPSLGGNNIQELQTYTSDPDNFVFNEYTENIDGQTYTWPIIWNSSNMNNNKKISDIVDIVQSRYIYNPNYYNENSAYLSGDICIGKFLHKGSVLYKQTKWGDNPDDYVIVYDPMKQFNRQSEFYATYQKTDKVVKHKEDVRLYVDTRFKWIRDIYGDILPYGGTKEYKSAKLYKFMSVFNEYSFNSAYNADQYCYKMYQLNKSKYNSLKTVIKSINDIDVKYKKYINDSLNKLSEHIQYTQEISELISTLSEESSNKINSKIFEISNKYAAYQFAINETIVLLNTVNKHILDIQKRHDLLQKDILNMDMTTNTYNLKNNEDTIKSTIKTIDTIDIVNIDKHFVTLESAKEDIEYTISKYTNES